MDISKEPGVAKNLALEAGGMMTDLSGKERTYNQEDTLLHGFLASNNTNHEELLKLDYN